MKTCIACKHFYFYGGERGYSSMTPGSSASVQCEKKHWDAEGADSSQFLVDVALANTCADYELSDIAKEKGFTE